MSIKDHHFVILDSMQEQLESVKSGVKPESFRQSIITGTQNVPSSLTQRSALTSSNLYVTYPLSPISGDINCLDSSFIEDEFNLEFDIKTKNAVPKDLLLPMLFGMRQTDLTNDQLQLLLENSAIWSTTFHHEEANIIYNSLPETEIAGNNQYASIDKMKAGLESPMMLCYFKLLNGATVHPQKIHFKYTVDVSRLDPLISNMHFVSDHFGNLKIKRFFNNIIQGLSFCPAYNLVNLSTASSYDLSKTINNSSAETNIWSFYSFSKYYNNTLDPAEIPMYVFDGAVFNLLNTVPGGGVDQTITFTDPSTAGSNFFKMTNSNMCQCNLDLYEDELNAFNEYVKQQGAIIIPSQTFATNIFNNSPIEKSAADQLNLGYTATLSGYNINSVHVWAHPRLTNSHFINLRLSNYQLLLNGRPLNPIPYESLAGRTFTDNIQALNDLDHEEINHDFVRSMSWGLTFPGSDKIAAGAKEQNGYILDMSKVYPRAALNAANVSNPATLTYNFATNMPDAFHSGACTLEYSNREAMIRLTGNINNAVSAAGTYPQELTIRNDSADIGVSALCDVCIVLSYDPVREKAFNGTLSWADPVK